MQIISKTLATLVACALLPGMVHAACNPSIDGYTLDWNATSMADETETLSVSVPRDDLTSSQTMNVAFAFSGNVNRFLSGWPQISRDFQGGFGGNQRSLGWAVDFSNNNQDVALTITFPQAVEDLSFQVLDVDSLDTSQGNGFFRDGVTIDATGPEGIAAPVFALATNSTIYLGGLTPDNVALGVFGNSDNNSSNGTLFVSFSQAVTQVTIGYTNAFFPQSSNPAPQGIGLYDIVYCVPRLPEITATKTQAIHGETSVGCADFPGVPDPSAQVAIPGACIEYTIQAQNTGDGTASALTLTDVLNPNLIFVGATSSGFAASGPGFTLATPATMQDCAGGACTVSLNDATLAPGASGEIIIRTILK